jgi:predicted metal-dependent hydrolase
MLGTLPLEVARKDVKYVRITVRGHEGQVRVSAPRHLSDKAVLDAVERHAAWIERTRERLRARPRLPQPELTSGAQLLVAGCPMTLEVVEGARASGVRQDGKRLVLHVSATASPERRAELLDRWYRAQLRKRAQELVAQWEPRLGVSVAELRVRRMTTRWGSCNINARRIWLNLELARRRPACLEYVVVHEMMHLLERRHDQRFRARMDAALPGWRELKRELNAG